MKATSRLQAKDCGDVIEYINVATEKVIQFS